MPDPTFYRSPAAAITAAPEELAYVAAFDPDGERPDAMTVVDCDPESSSYGQVVGWTDFSSAGKEVHHFGWNACSSALCHEGHGHDGHGQLERRYLIVPGLRSSRTFVLDTKDDPRSPRSSRRSSRPGPATPARTRCTAGPAASSCRTSAARTGPTSRAASRSSTTTPSR
jgi:selenium-binding protein 1